MPQNASPTIAMSSWSVHRALGLFHPNAPDNDVAGNARESWGPGTVTLMDLPAELARRGIDRLQLCHFHLASRDAAYLGEMRAALADAGVTLQTLLIDNGDITHPTEGGRDRDWIGRWIDAAAVLGAGSARVIAGKQKPTAETLAAAVAGLRELGRRGSAQGVRILTENWFDLLAGPTEVDSVLDRVDGAVGFLADFGNWKGAAKYDALAAVLARAEDTHAKAHFGAPGVIDADDFGRCLAAATAAGYDGPYTLIYESAGDDEWGGVAIERDFVRGYFAARAGATAGDAK
jgi:sugar phosphate isomerase/epimerase